jgi:lipopolysaccharide/colanic/teichoic acid biosynthesis glycosyltransferase
MLKIRTMWGSGPGSPSRGWVEYVETAPVDLPKTGPDPRVTSRFAAWCRRYSMDELPQLLHVVSGRMSLVGPRPLTQYELDAYYGPSATAEVLSVRPGLSGLWQTMGRNRLTYRQRRRLDVFLVRHPGWRLYLRILVATVPRAAAGHGAW